MYRRYIMEIMEYLICIFVVAAGAAIGMLIANYITYRMMGSKRFCKRFMKRYMKIATKISKELMEDY